VPDGAGPVPSAQDGAGASVVRAENAIRPPYSPVSQRQDRRRLSPLANSRPPHRRQPAPGYRRRQLQDLSTAFRHPVIGMCGQFCSRALTRMTMQWLAAVEATLM
jgi:hypothetical protein